MYYIPGLHACVMPLTLWFACCVLYGFLEKKNKENMHAEWLKIVLLLFTEETITEQMHSNMDASVLQ